MKVADFFKVPLMYFLVPEDEVDSLLGRIEEKKDDDLSYELHQTVIKLGKAEAELRAKDKEIEELKAELAETHVVTQPAKSEIPGIVNQELRLNIRLLEAIADYMEAEQ